MALSKRKLKLRSKRNRYQIKAIRLTMSIIDLSPVIAMPMPRTVEDGIAVFGVDDWLSEIRNSMATSDVTIPPECTTPEQVDAWLMTNKLMSPEECRSIIENFNVEDMYPKYHLEDK